MNSKDQTRIRLRLAWDAERQARTAELSRRRRLGAPHSAATRARIGAGVRAARNRNATSIEDERAERRRLLAEKVKARGDLARRQALEPVHRARRERAQVTREALLIIDEIKRKADRLDAAIDEPLARYREESAGAEPVAQQLLYRRWCTEMRQRLDEAIRWVGAQPPVGPRLDALAARYAAAGKGGDDEHDHEDDVRPG